MDFFYDGQIRRYVTQFMRIFIGFKYEAGDGKQQTVPVMYGDLTRQVANIIRENSENKMPTVPRMACYITGLKGYELFSQITQYSKKIRFDTNAQVFVNYENNARGLFWISTTAKGGIYGLKIRVFGTKGSLEWTQNDPNYLIYSNLNGATKKLDRGYNESFYSKKFSRIKFGHPEGYLSAFSNLYKEISHKIKKKKTYKNFLFPNEDDGLLTAKYIDACVKSSKNKKWVKINA